MFLEQNAALRKKKFSVGGMLKAAAGAIGSLAAMAVGLVSMVIGTKIPKDYDYSMGPMPNEYRYIQENKWAFSEGAGDGSNSGKAGKTNSQMQAKNMWALWPTQPMNKLLQDIRATPSVRDSLNSAFSGVKETAAASGSGSGGSSGSSGSGSDADAGLPKYLAAPPSTAPRAKAEYTLLNHLKGVFP